MEFCHAVATTLGKLSLEPAQDGRVYGAALLAGLGRELKAATVDRHLPNLFRDATMGGVSKWVRRATRCGGQHGGEIQECLLSALSDMNVHCREVVGAAEKLQCYALMMLAAYYVNCDFGRDKPRGAARAVQVFEDAVLQDAALGEALEPALHPPTPLVRPAPDPGRTAGPAPPPASLPIISALYSLHTEALFLCSAVALPLPSAPPTPTAAEAAVLCDAADAFTRLLSRLVADFAVESLAAVAAHRQCPEGAYMRPPAYRVQMLDSMCSYVERRTGASLVGTDYLAL